MTVSVFYFLPLLWHLHWVAKLFFKWGVSYLHEVNNLKTTREVFIGAVLGWAFGFVLHT